MGVYDFFKGECPYCYKQIDVDPEYGKCGDIQTKLFIYQPNDDDCFREFYPGDQTPIEIEYMEICIGPTCCCGEYIIVIIKDSIIQEYERVHNHVF
jgi:hypothetical protein